MCDLLSKVLFILNYTFFLATIFILNLVAIQFGCQIQYGIELRFNINDRQKTDMRHYNLLYAQPLRAYGYAQMRPPLGS